MHLKVATPDARNVKTDIPNIIDTGTSSGTTLLLRRDNALNTNVLALQSLQVGGRTTIEFRDDTGTGLARIVAHNELDTPGVAAGIRIYGLRATPRLDGNMYDNRFLVESKLDFTNIYGFGATWNMESHDTDGNLNTDKTIVKIFRDPTDFANESFEFGRARTSATGSAYLHRNLAAADTSGPLVRIFNENAGDDQIALKIVQANSQVALEVTNSAGSALSVNGSAAGIFVVAGYTDIPEQADPAGPSADRLRLYAKDTGSGKTILAQRTTSGVEHHYGALIGSVAYDPPSLAVAASAKTTVTVTGAAVGDMAVAGLVGIAATGWEISAVVIGANTVEVKITNNTAGVVDLASSTLRAIVWKVA